MTKELKDFEDVQMWKGLKQLAKEIYEGFVSCNDYSFVDQIKRASVSSNVAEGAERGTSTEFARFLDIAKGSCGEVRSMLRLAGELDYLKEVDADKLAEDCIKISKQLGGFSKYLRNKSLALK
ncbi:MAG: four helix bundle protein [Opitutales bacterium]|nr:four helix bundle protein [Opitutales bacterium]